MCECRLCVRSRLAESFLSRLPAEDRDFWEGIYSELEHAELDRDVNGAVIDGSWPTADENIAAARAKVNA